MKPDWHYTKIAIHHAGRSFACSDGANQVASILDTHLSKKFDDIRYHFEIDCLGTIYEGRDIRLKDSNVLHYNTGVTGVVLLEDMTAAEEGADTIAMVRTLIEDFGIIAHNTAPDAQTNSLKILIRVLKDVFLINILGGGTPRISRTTGRRKKICPGNIEMQLVSQLRGRTTTISAG